MFTKCYYHIAELSALRVAERATFSEKWSTFLDMGNSCYLLTRHISGKAEYAPLFIISFPLLAPHTLLEAQKFNIRYSDPSRITEIADKLRYYRYKKALLQRQVAECLGIDRTTYKTYEEKTRDAYPPEHMTKLAELFEVPVTTLLDEYNTFLYNDQGKQIKSKRLALHMTQTQYATYLGVPLQKLKRWETNKVTMTKTTWEKLFKE